MLLLARLLVVPGHGWRVVLRPSSACCCTAYVALSLRLGTVRAKGLPRCDGKKRVQSSRAGV
eukprot:1988234-Alexandrium_andersonii.AAC.1